MVYIDLFVCSFSARSAEKLHTTQMQSTASQRLLQIGNNICRIFDAD
jgi:hypothetical protein